jgi:DNA-binding response OmpR family regulator
VRDFGDLVIDSGARRVTLRANPVELTKTEFDILLLLSESPGRVCTLEQIYRNVWKDEYIGAANTVIAHIKNLRNKLGESPRDRGFIGTVWGVCYKFAED